MTAQRLALQGQFDLTNWAFGDLSGRENGLFQASMSCLEEIRSGTPERVFLGNNCCRKGVLGNSRSVSPEGVFWRKAAATLHKVVPRQRLRSRNLFLKKRQAESG